MAAPSTTRPRGALRRLAGRGPLAALAVIALALPASAAADTAVSITDTAYAPATVTIEQGEVVTWVNDGTKDHTVTSDTGTTMQSDVLGPGDSFATLFTKAGTFGYHSTVASDDMAGTVIVKPAKVPTATGPTPPTGTVPEGFTPGSGTAQTTTETVSAQDDDDEPTALLIAGAAAAVAAAVVIALLLVRRRKGRSGA